MGDENEQSNDTHESQPQQETITETTHDEAKRIDTSEAPSEHEVTSTEGQTNPEPPNTESEKHVGAGNESSKTNEQKQADIQPKTVTPAASVAVKPVGQSAFRAKQGPTFLKRLRRPPTTVQTNEAGEKV